VSRFLANVFVLLARTLRGIRLIVINFDPKITYALVNDTLYAVKETLEKPNVENILKARVKNCFEPGKRSTSSAKALLKILNGKVSYI